MVHVTGFELDAERPDPLFRQIADQIVARIERGVFPQGFRLPPTRTLAQELGTHRNTVVRAYEALADGGWVTSVVGRGTFVDAPPEPTSLRARTPRAPAPKAEASRLSWEGLLSSAGRAEVLSRASRLPKVRRTREAPVDLATMQPSADMLPDQALRRCVDHVLRTRGAKALGYAPREGLGRLRELLVEDLARRGVPASADEIIVTTGSQQALDLIARALVDPGDAFAIDAQTYTGAMHVLAMAGGRLVPVASDEEGPELSALERFATVGGAKGVYLMPNCRNPTGAQISAERRRALVAWSRRVGLPLIEDDYGADLALDDAPLPPALRAMDSDVLHVSTFSKRLIPALRVGFLVCPRGLMERLVALKHAMDLGTSVLLQHALAEFLERGYMRSHLRRIVPVYRARRDALEHALSAHMPEDVRWRPLKHGLVLWLTLPPDVGAEALFAQAQRLGVWVAPSTLHAVGGLDQSAVRLTIARETPERIERGVALLAQALHDVRGTRSSRASLDVI